MRLRTQVIFFTLVRILPNTAVRMIYPFLSVFARGMGVSLPMMSVAISTRSLLGVLGPVLSALADHFGHKSGMLLGFGLFTLGCALISIFPLFPVFILFLCLSVLGMFFYLASVQAYVSDRIPYAERGLVLGVIETSWAASFFIGVPLVGLLVEHFGWQSPFPVLTILGLLVCLVIWRAIPAMPPSAHSPTGSHLFSAIPLIFKTPVAVMALVMSMCFAGANEIVGLVFGVFMEDTFGLKIAALGAASAVIGVSELAGELFSSGWVDRLGKERLVRAGLLINILASLALIWLGRDLVTALIGLFIFYFSFELAMVSSFSMMTEIYPAARATFIGVNFAAIAFGRMVCSLLSPQIYTFGFQFNVLAALALDVVAIVALSRIRVGKTDPHLKISGS